MSPRRLKKCAAHQARQDGATAIMTRRRHYAARSLGVSALSIERRCRSVVWDRKKVRFKVGLPAAREMVARCPRNSYVICRKLWMPPVTSVRTQRSGCCRLALRAGSSRSVCVDCASTAHREVHSKCLVGQRRATASLRLQYHESHDQCITDPAGT